MKHVIIGQVLLILCCAVYLIWWYRGFRPDVTVNRVGGTNGILLAVTAVLGVAGIALSLLPVSVIRQPVISQSGVAICGMIVYVLLLLVTRGAFHRIVTTELILIVGWTTLEIVVCDRLYAAGAFADSGFLFACLAIAAAFLISIVLYVAYYRMEEMKAFYAAMIPLVTEAIAMAVVVGMTSAGK